MLKFNFNRIFKARGIDRPFTHLVDLGFQRSAASRMNTGKIKSMSLKELERLCEMFECTPNDLLEWVPGKYMEDITKHPLKSLIRAESPVNIKAMLDTLPVAHLDEIEKFIQEKAKQVLQQT